MLAKLRLNDFAIGPPTIDLTSCASDSKSSFRPRNAFVASIVTFPSTPVTLPRASAICGDGTATSRTSAADASPPSRPSSCASCPASRHSLARPPPTFPLPIPVIFMSVSNVTPCSRLPAMPREYPTALDLVGGTPIVRLDRLSPPGHARIVAKLEYLNPGGSLKDRIGLAMIEQAERDGKLKPGGTIVEPTSGNTGVGLAIAAAGKGYRCVFVMPDKMSQEKISMLRAYGAEVVITPTAVDHDSPESYYSVSSRLAEEIPGGFKPDQYSNMANPDAHYRLTGPEIWEQTGGELDAIVVSVRTGGTISGVGRYFKERKPEVLIVGADPEGSVYTAKRERDVHPYLVEGIGKDTWPKTMDPSVVDEWVRVSDRDSFLTARRLAREEGILVGGSGGTTVWAALEIAKRFGPEATILTMIPDSGRSYMSKFYDDNWMLEHGFVERRAPPPTVLELLRAKRMEETEVPTLITIAAHQKVGEAI